MYSLFNYDNVFMGAIFCRHEPVVGELDVFFCVVPFFPAGGGGDLLAP